MYKAISEDTIESKPGPVKTQGQSSNWELQEEEKEEQMALSNEDLIGFIKKGKLSKEEESALEFLKKGEEKKEKKVDRKAEEKKLRASLSALQFLLTDMTNGKLPSSGINHVIERYADDHWAEEYRVDIPEVDPFFQWEPDVLEAVWLSYSMNERCLCVGPPGSGKTTVTRQLAAWLRQPYARFNGKDSIDASAFLGSIWATKEGMEWRDGLMPIAVREGYLTVIDEIFKLPPGIQMAMQSLYEKGGFLMLDEKPGTVAEKYVRPKAEFRLYGTDNTKGTGDSLGSYAAGQIQDISSLDRFPMTIEVEYLKQKDEEDMIAKKFPAVSPSLIKKIVSFANLVRQGFRNGDISLTMSPRGSFVACQLIERNIPLDKALHLTFVNKLSSDVEVKVVKGFITSAV